MTSVRTTVTARKASLVMVKFAKVRDIELLFFFYQYLLLVPFAAINLLNIQYNPVQYSTFIVSP